MNDMVITTEPTLGALSALASRSVPTILAADQNDILGALKRELDALDADISTPAGRAKIKSAANRVATSKMDLVRLANGMMEDDRKRIAAILAERKIIEERMDDLKVQVRAPLTEWENVEKDWVAGHESVLAAMADIVHRQTDTGGADWIENQLRALQDTYEGKVWDLDYRQRAASEYAAHQTALTAALDRVRKAEAEAEELARLRAAEAERARLVAEQERRDHEARIAAEAAEAARIEVERKASAAAAEAAAKAERARELAELNASLEKAAAERREQAAKDAAERAERNATAADERARLAEEQAKAERIASIKREADAKVEAQAEAVRRERAATEAAERRHREAKAAEEAETRNREANRAHRGKINRAVMDALTLLGLSDDIGRAVVMALAKNEIPHCRIEY